MKAFTQLTVLAAFTFASATSVLAQPTDHDAHHATAVTETVEATAVSSEDSGSSLSEGTIRKVDQENQKITIRHGELKNLDMPPMTMVFQVKDPAFLNAVKAGDEVKFTAEKIGGKFTVTHIEK